MTRVDFYRGTTLLASDTTSPYGYTWSNVGRGHLPADGCRARQRWRHRNLGCGRSHGQLGDQPGAGRFTDLARTGRVVHRAGERHADRIGQRHGRHGRARRVLSRVDAHRVGYDESVFGGLERRGGRQLLADGARRGQRRGDAHVDGRRHHRHVSNQSAADGFDHQSDRRPVVHGAGLADDRRRRRAIPTGRSPASTSTSGPSSSAPTRRVPTSAAWTNVAAGSYSLTAVARDNAGGDADVSGHRGDGHRDCASTEHARLRAPRPITRPTSRPTSWRSIVRPIPMTASPVATRDLGKPTPVSGEISVDISTLVNPLPAGLVQRRRPRVRAREARPRARRRRRLRSRSAQGSGTSGRSKFVRVNVARTVLPRAPGPEP